MISINNVSTMEQLDNWKERMESYHQSIIYANKALADGMAIHRPIMSNPFVSLQEIQFRFDSKKKELTNDA